MPNLYGNIVDNLASGLVGGAGVLPGMVFLCLCFLIPILTPFSSFRRELQQRGRNLRTGEFNH